MSKYIGKDMDNDNEEYAGKKRYWASKSLYRPITVTGFEAISLLHSGSTETYRKSHDIETEEGTETITRITVKLNDSPFWKLAHRDAATQTEIRARRLRGVAHTLNIKDLIQRLQEGRNYEELLRGESEGDIANTITRKHHFDRAAKEEFRPPLMDGSGIARPAHKHH